MRFITRIDWRDELSGEICALGAETARYEESKDKIWEIDPFSEEILWK